MTDADWVEQERNHEYRMASLKEDADRRTREHRTKRFEAAMWTIGIIGVLSVLTAFIYGWQHDAGMRGNEVEIACVTSGGTWTSVGGGTQTCIRITQGEQ